MKKIFLGLMACAALCACTSDDLVSNVTTQKTFSGDVAYMTVSIKDVNSGTRATDGGYKYGSAEEHAVSNAYFYFYDEAGVFVSQAEVWDGGVDGTTENVEFEGNTVIVLKGLTGIGYPNYVVTILNKPSGFIPASTLGELATQLSDASAVGTNDASGNFVMSTSSYVDTDDARAAYFVTPITEDNFYEEPVSTSIDNPVDIYVERLAAKVETGIATTLANTATTLGDGTTGYRLTETIAGDENEQSSDNDAGDEIVYVKILGWALNGTAKHSNMMKDITGFDVTDGVDGWTGWNNASYHRSFWGKSFNYGLGFGQYPTSSEGASSSAGEGKTMNEWLDYVSYNDLTLDMDESKYCAENTNNTGAYGGTNAVIQTKNTSAITNVLIAAEVCGADGEGLDLVRYQGELFTKEAFLNYVMTELKTTGATNWNVYVMTSEEGVTPATYAQIDATYLTFGKELGGVERYDGYIVVLADEDAFTAGTYYYNTGTTDDDGNPIMVAYASVAAAIAAVNEPLEVFDAAHDAINAYTGGQMYYSVPIEHLNNGDGITDTDGNVIPLEANYGIVRNHWYQLTINSITELGKGVYDPDEVIIPNIDDEKYYYVGADIHILSWKLVSQDVAL